jgi:hypothetical protein
MDEANDQSARPRQEWGFRLREAPDVIDPGYETEDHARLCASRAAGNGIVTRFHSGSIVSEWQDVPDTAKPSAGPAGSGGPTAAA